MQLENLLSRLKTALQPPAEARADVKKAIQQRISEPQAIKNIASALQPTADQKHRIWQNIQAEIRSPKAENAFDLLRDALQAPSIAVRHALEPRFQPVHVSIVHRPVFRWVAACLVVSFAVRSMPLLFVASPTAAESPVLLIPTKSGVELSLHDLWQPISDQIQIQEAPIKLRTSDGEATLILHDDGTVRLAPDTLAALKDLSDRPQVENHETTLTVQSGEAWIQGFVPRRIEGLHINTPHGTVTVNGGSVSIVVGTSDLKVSVWDRQAIVIDGDRQFTLHAGEEVTLTGNESDHVRRIPQSAYDQEWVEQNLERDAVHQREIAQMQQERRAASAGILPTSPLYPVKRVAESLDLLMTLDPESRVQKKLDQATTRLNEAAALIASGANDNAAESLEEYKAAVIEIAAGTGSTQVAQELVNQELALSSAELAASLPDDESYALKKTVLETISAVPNEPVLAQDVHGTLVADAVDVLKEAMVSGDIEKTKTALTELAPYLPTLSTDSAIDADLRHEAVTVLSQVASGLREQSDAKLDLSSELSEQLRPYVPREPRVGVAIEKPLTDAQIEAIVDRVLRHIFETYTMPQSRENEVRAQVMRWKGSTDEGRLLRALLHALPEDSDLRKPVRRAIQLLREEQLSDGLHGAADDEETTGSGELLE